MRRIVVVFALLVLAACGSSSGNASPTTPTPTATAKPVLTVGVKPSESSKMICGEAKPAIADNLGVKASKVTTPTWVNDVYSCSYVYPDGSFTLSVKEVDGLPAAARYFDGLKSTLGVQPGSHPPELGQGAFVTANGGLVVQKDNKVLTVDVAKLPTRFGPEHTSPAAVAVAVGGVIMGCWTGA